MPKQEPSHEGSSGLILRLADEVFRKRGTDEHCWRDIRTPGFIPLPYLPIRSAFPRNCILNSGLQGFVTRYRGGTVPESHGVPASPTALFHADCTNSQRSKNRASATRITPDWQCNNEPCFYRRTQRTQRKGKAGEIRTELRVLRALMLNPFLQKAAKDTEKGKSGSFPQSSSASSVSSCKNFFCHPSREVSHKRKARLSSNSSRAADSRSAFPGSLPVGGISDRSDSCSHSTGSSGSPSPEVISPR